MIWVIATLICLLFIIIGGVYLLAEKEDRKKLAQKRTKLSQSDIDKLLKLYDKAKRKTTKRDER